jgi:hypothetical protein
VFEHEIVQCKERERYQTTHFVCKSQWSIFIEIERVHLEQGTIYNRRRNANHRSVERERQEIEFFLLVTRDLWSFSLF